MPCAAGKARKERKTKSTSFLLRVTNHTGTYIVFGMRFNNNNLILKCLNIRALRAKSSLVETHTDRH